MRVLHAPVNIANQASTIAKAQRALGIKADVLVFKRGVYNFDADIDLALDKKPKLLWPIIVFENFIRCVPRYDVFHFHYGWSLLPWNLDLPILRLLGKKVVMEYWGSDAIQTDIAVHYTNWTKGDLKRIYPHANDSLKRLKLGWHRLWAKTVVGDYSLLPFSPKSIVVRQAIDVSGLPYVGAKPHKGKVCIVHAPTNREIKGTKHIIAAVERLKQDGYPIEFVLVENKAHRDAMRIFKAADIVADDVLQGPYGILSIECMALGKPVLDHIHHNLVKYYPGLPIVNTSPETVYGDLKRLVKDGKLRERLGRQGRAYVEKHHDARKIAKQFIELYNRL